MPLHLTVDDKAVANGVASLGADVKIPVAQVPQGPGSTLDADTLDGKDSAIFEEVSRKGAASGYATLNASTKVLEDPANATATPTASKILIADAGGKVDGWVSDAAAATKGKVQLAGHLGGSAASPTVVNHAPIASDLHTVYILATGARAFTGTLLLGVPLDAAALNFPDVAGVPPSTPANGDMWRDGASLTVRLAAANRILEHQGNKGVASGYASLDGSLLVVEAAKNLRETGGPTTLAAGPVADGAFFRRSASSYLGAFAPRILECSRQNATATGAGWVRLHRILIPANTINVDRLVRFEYHFRRTTGAGTWSFRILYANNIAVTASGFSNANNVIRGFLSNDGASNAQRNVAEIYPVSNLVTATTALDSTIAQNMDFEIDLGTDADVFTLDRAIIRVEGIV